MRRQHLPIMMIMIAALAALIWSVDPCFAGPGGGTYYANSPAGGVTGTPLRKFVDSLPGLGFANRNNLGQYIPVAIPDTTTYAGSDYYEIGLKEYTQRMHSDLPKATTLRGYYQINTNDTTVRNVNQYLGPLIIGKRDRPVRVKFVNSLPTGTAGNLFIPVDTSLMGAGTGPDAAPGTNCNTVPKPASCYTENRATLHLHGGNSPWISDGTPHQWTVPAGEATPYQKGVSTRDVPDMPPTGNGQMTFYWPNQQSGRLMFYHDHAYGITRLNVYAGEAAGYLLVDPAEEAMIASGVLPDLGGVYRYGIPLVIQDKTFVPANIVSKPATTGVPAIVGQDDKWDLTKWGQPGDLWFPHVYEANQDPFSPDGANPFGRWDYGPWFWPPVNVDAAHAVLPTPSATPEAFADTPLVNGAAYPYLQVQPRVYRFRILNASNDRALNLQIYYADPADPTGKEVKMVPAAPNPAYPPDWPTDGRAGGVPDPATVGPNMIQIGTEGGFLPNPVVITNRPVGFDYNRRNIVVLNILNRALMLGPAERADVIIDFSSVPAGSKLILYNDAPAPTPAFDPRYDYYTANPDQSTSGGAPSTLAGYGPNTRTIMQFQVAGTPSAPFNLGALQTALPAAFKAAQPTPIVPETVYNSVYTTTPTTNDLYSKISDFSFTFTPIGTTIPSTIQFRPKAIQELWDPYGRMNATLGVELPFTNSITQTTVPLGYAEPPTEFVYDGQPQIWKITHNGVDSHPVHFHLFSVQVINRVGWDGAIRVPEDNELGWKETVMMNPLEDVIVALQPYKQTLPFALPTSSRLLDPTVPPGTPIATTNMTVSPPVPTTIPNAVLDYGFEYVWHCHILGHEENDFMRPLVFRVPTIVPAAPTGLTAILGGQTANGITNPSVNEVVLTWTDNASNEATFRIERAPVTGGGTIGAYAPLGTTSLLPSSTPVYTDSTVSSNTQYSYRVFAFNSLGDSHQSNIVPVATPAWSTATSLTITPDKPSPHIEGTNVIFTALATGPTPSVVYHYRFTLTGGGTSTVVQDYSIKTMWALPSTAAPGTYTITVDVLSSISTPLPVPDKTASLTYVVVVPVVPIGSFSPVPGTYSQAVSGPSVMVTLSANVPANIFYTLNGTTPNTLSTRYTAPIPLTASTTINFIAVDASGSSSVVNTATYIIHVSDLTATVLINNGAVSTNTTSVTLKLAASDPTGVATMQFSNDNITYSAEELFATTKSWNLSQGLATPVPDGVRTVYVRFRDNSLPLPGTLYSPVTATIIMDRVAPVTTALPAAGMYAATSAPIFVTLMNNEPGTTYYTIDGTIPTSTSNVYLTPILVSTQTTIKYFSVDLAGNAEPVNTGTWSFDTGNDITSSIVINGGLISTSTLTVTLSLLATDPTGSIVQMQFSNDGSVWSAAEAYATSKSWVLPPGDGIKTVYVRFQDNLGVWSSPFTVTIALITGAPVTTASPIPGIYSAAPVFVTLTPNNPLSKIYYTTDLSAPTTASQVYTGAIALNATTTINYFSVDIAGNSEVYKTGTWTISAGDMAASVGINNGSLFTNNTAVLLALSAVGPAGVKTMQFSNDGVAYSPEEAYATSKAWTLLSGDGLKTVYVRYRDNSLPAPGVLHTPVTANITLDTTTPVTTVGPIPGTYSSPPISVILAASEAATIYYTTDGTVPTAASTVYTGPISVAATTTIKYFAVDLAGNAEAVKTGTWTINTGIITASMQINNGASITSSPTVTLSLLASVPAATIVSMIFSNDGINYSAEEAFAPTKVWLLSAGDGNKTVYVRFKDTSHPPVLYPPVSTSIKLDTTAPVTAVSPIPGSYSTTAVSVTLTANEPATIHYTLDGTAPTTASAVYTGAISTAVTATVRYFAVDAAGNTEAIKSATWTILSADLVASAQINDGAARTNNSSVVLHLSAVDPVGVATMQFSNDGLNYTAEEAYAATKAWTLTAGDGIKTVYIRFRDNSLPTGYLYTPVMASVILDTVAPVTSASPVTGDYAVFPVMVTLSANEPATIYYTLDGTTPTTRSTVYTGTLSVTANTTIQYFAVDLAGNVETVKSGTWSFDTGNDITASIVINGGLISTSTLTVTLSLLATDPTGSIVQMQFSNDGSVWSGAEAYATSKSWVLPPGDGIKTVYVRFQDNLGVWSPPFTATIALITGAPVTTASPIPGIYSAAPVFVTLTPNNPLSKIYYTTDLSAPTTASQVYTGAIALNATTTINYFSVDIAGNSEVYKTGTWTISAGDMAASVGINNGSLFTNNTAVLLALSAVGPAGVKTMQFSNDGVAYSPEEAYATSKAWTLLSGDGLKTVYVRYRDNSLPAPGVLHTPVTANITLDTTTPVTTVGPIPGTYSSPPISVILAASEAATIYYTTDGTVPTAASTVYTGPISVAATTTIKYFAVDLAGNAEAVKTGTWTINTGIITASMQINNGASITSSPTVTLSLLASVPAATIVSMIFSNDGINYSAEEAFAPTKVWLLSAGDGNKTVYVRFKDTSHPPVLYPPVSTSIKLDTTAPVTAVSPIPGSYSTTAVSVTLTANEPATIHYTLDGTAPTTASAVYTGAISTAVTATVRYFAVDAAGNTEAIKSATWTILSADLVASAQINDGAARTNNSSVVLHLSAVDPVGVATMQFSNDGLNYTAEEAYAATKAWTLTAGDGIKTVYIRFRDNSLPTGYLYTPVMASVILDTVAPVTSASPVTGDYAAAPVMVTLSANEPATIYYTIDGTTPTTGSTVYTGTLSVTANTTIQYFAVDLAGNVETVKSGIWTIHTADITASVVINNGAARTNNGTVALTLSAIDPVGVATMQFSNDGNNYTVEEPYATSKTWVLSPGDGIKTVYVRFRDNTLPTGFLYSPVTSNISLDTIAPITTASPITGVYSNAPISVTLSSNETAAIYYTTDGSTPSAGSPKYTGPISVAATTTIKYFGVDLAGNSEAYTAGTWTIHAVDMTASVVINNDVARTNSAAVTLTLNAIDPAGIASMQFSNDGTNYTVEEPYATSKAWVLSPGDGLKTVYVRFRDKTLPTGALYPPVTSTITLDTIAPVTTVGPIPGSYSTTPVSITLTANEPATIHYTLDGTAPTAVSAVYTGAISTDVTATVRYFAVDAAGNTEAIKSATWTILSADLVASAQIKDGAARTNNSSVVLYLSAVDPVGVATMQFSNDGLNYTAEEAYAATKAWTLTAGDGIKTVYIRFRDNSLPTGYLYTPVMASVVLDTVAPVTSASPVTGDYATAPVMVTLSANEPATIHYTLDGTTPTTGSTVYTGAISVTANTTIKYFAVDLAGNVETVKSGTWTIHSTSLTSSVKINNGAIFATGTAVTLSILATDSTGNLPVSMQLSNDGVSFTAEEPFATSRAWTLSSGDGLKTVYVRIRDASLNGGFLHPPVIATITLDSSAPITTASPITGVYSNAPISVTLSSNETAAIYYTTNGSAPSAGSPRYTGPISVAATTTIKYFGVDLAGNSEAYKTGTWTIHAADMTASVVINNGVARTNSAAVTLTLNAIDPVGIASMRFSNDGTNYTVEEPYATSKAWVLSPGDGLKTVYVRFRDKTLPTGALYPPVTSNITLDTIAPVTTVGPIPGSYSTTPVSITLTANEPATIHYTLDGTAPTAVSAVYTGAISTDVTATVRYFAVDAAGNTEAIKSATWTILSADLVASAQIKDGAARTNNGSVVLHLSAVDPVGVATMQFSNDGLNYTAEEAYAATKAWTLTAGDGIKTVYIRFRDNSLPTGYLYTPVMASVVLDTVAPVTSASPVTGDYATAPVMVTLSTNEPATIHYTLDGTTPTTGSTVYTGAISVTANTTIKYFAVDLAGNVETVKSGTWTIHSTSLTSSVKINNGAIFATGTAVTLSILATDSTGNLPVSMQLSNDGVSFTAEEPFATSRAWTLSSGDGLKTVYVRIRDASLNGGFLHPPVIATITLDSSAPITTASPITGVYANAPISVTLSSNETAATYYTTNGSTPSINSPKYTGPISVAATTTIKYFGVDLAGNSEAYKTGTWTIHAADMTASVVINNGVARTNSAAVTLTLNAIDPVGIASMRFSNDGTNYTVEEPYATSKAWVLSPGDGLKTVYVRFRDKTLPIGALYPPVTSNITLDTIAPVTTASPITGIYAAAPVAVTLTVNEPAAIYYTVDGTAPTTGSSVYTGPISVAAATTIHYFAIDAAGNKETLIKSGAWTFDTDPDMTARILINSGMLWTTMTDVALTLSATDPSGVKTMQFSNNGITYTTEEPYAASKAWTLSSGDGIKTVYVRFRDGSLPSGFLHSPVSATITLDTSVMKGDINNDGHVDLMDLILALQVASRSVPATMINNHAAVIVPGKIGLQEAIYILQKVAGMR